jgi:hypothetical protein
MEFKTQTRTQQILTVMKILSWVAFFAFAIEAGAILFSYIMSVVNPDAARKFYKVSNLYTLRQLSLWYFTGTVSFMVALAAMKAYISFLVIKILSGINLSSPFKTETVIRLEKISYQFFGMWLIAMISAGYAAWLVKLTGEMHGTYTSGESIFVAGLVFIVSQVFKRGVEIQSENELTV